MVGVTQGLLDAQRGPDVLRVRQTPRLLGIVMTLIAALIAAAGGLQIWFSLGSGARSGVLYGVALSAVGLLAAWRFRSGIVIRFERAGGRVNIVWHRGERILREESLPAADILHVVLETAIRRARAANDVYRVVIATSSKGDILLTDGFSMGQAFFERQREEIRLFLGVAGLATRERRSDS